VPKHSIHDCRGTYQDRNTRVTRTQTPQSVEYTTSGENFKVKLGWNEALCCVLEESTRQGEVEVKMTGGCVSNGE